MTSELSRSNEELKAEIAERERVAAELRESEERFRVLSESSLTGIYLIQENRFRYVNPAMARMFGYTVEELVDRLAPADLVYPDDRDIVAEHIRRRLAGEVEESRYGFRGLRKDGSVFLLEVHGRRVQHGGRIGVIGTLVDNTERKRAEEEHQAYLWFLESMDRINRAMQGSGDLERMLNDVLGTVLSIFDCDRAWLVYPCDSEAASWRVPMEHTRPEFPGAFALALDLPVTPEIAAVFQAVRASSGPVRFDPGSACPLPPETARRFSIQSMIAMAIYPKGDRPYMLGLHQCSYPRVWTPQEERLFQEIGRRLADALTSLLMFRSLRESERRLEDAQRIAHVGYWDRDLVAGRITLSDEGCRIFGLQPEDRVNDLPLAAWHERWQAVIQPDDRPRAAAAAAAALAGGPRYDVEYRVVHRTGEVRIVHSQGDVIRDESGRPCRMFGIMQDITDRKRAEAELRESEERFRTLVQFSFDVYWETDPQHRFTRQEFAKRLADAPAPGSEIGKTRWEVPYLEPDEEAWRQHRATLDAHLPFRDFELARPTPDGGKRYVSVSGLPVFDSTGRFLGYRGVGRHITERKRAEQALRQSEAYLAEAQRMSHTGSWAFDVASNKYVYVSEECARVFEWDAQAGLPTREAISRLIHPEDWDRVNADFETSLREKVETSSEFRITPPSGTVKHVHAIRHPVLNNPGDVVKVVGTVIDITERKRVEAELRARQELLDLAQKAARAVAFDWYIGAREGENRWSPELEAMYGLEPGTFNRTYQGWKKLVHPEDWPAVKVAINRAHESGDVAAEYRVIHKDGTVHWLRARGRMFFDAKGQPERMVGFMIDVTDWRHVEEALSASEAYLAEAQRLSHTGSWALDVASDEYVYLSEEWLRIYGFDAQEGLLNTEAVLQRIAPQDRDSVIANVEKSLREKVDTSNELRIVLPDGMVRHVYVIRHPVLNAAGDVVQLVGTSIDITERKRAEEALRESETRFRTFVDHAADAFFMLDFDRRTILDVNRRACESLGYTREELIGMTPLVFDVDLDQATLDSIAKRAAAGETVAFAPHRHRRKDGLVFPVEVQTSVFWHGGRRFLLKVARDISDRVRAEEQRQRLRQLELDLAHINRVSMMGELASSIAHEVNQPLSGVVSNASACLRWLARDVPNLDEAREAASRIVRDGKRAADVIARVRALARRAATPTEKLDLNETIQEVLALAGDEANRKHVIMRTQFADSLAPVAGDRVQLQQVGLNLIMNGIEAMSSVDERARELVITTRDVDADHVQVTVEDSGTGLDPNAMEKIFDPFYTTKPGGMGMGLSISRSIVQAHGGRLWATAKDGPGTMFHFTLPKYHEEQSHA